MVPEEDLAVPRLESTWRVLVLFHTQLVSQCMLAKPKTRCCKDIECCCNIKKVDNLTKRLWLTILKWLTSCTYHL